MGCHNDQIATSFFGLFNDRLGWSHFADMHGFAFHIQLCCQSGSIREHPLSEFVAHLPMQLDRLDDVFVAELTPRGVGRKHLGYIQDRNLAAEFLRDNQSPVESSVFSGCTQSNCQPCRISYTIELISEA